MPALSTRRAETDIDLQNGQSFGMAGLLDRRTTMVLSKVPGIGDIPFIGNLFRSQSYSKNNTDLMVMVTPTIVDPATEPITAPATRQWWSDLDTQAFDHSLGKDLTHHKDGN